jgi:hypothetical protein
MVAEWAAPRHSRPPSSTLILAGACAIVAALLVVNGFVTRLIVDHSRPPIPGTAAGQTSLLHDLAGISFGTRDIAFPEYVNHRGPTLDRSALRELYDPADAAVLVFNPRWRGGLVTNQRTEFDELVRMCRQSVTSHPGAYLRHRVAVLSALFHTSGIDSPFHEGIDPNDLGLRFRETPIHAATVDVLHRSERIFFRGWLYLLIALALLATGTRRTYMPSSLTALSGVLYVLPYAVISSGCVIASGALVRKSVLLQDAKVEAGAFVSDSVLCKNSLISKGATVTGFSVIGEGAKVLKNASAHSVKLDPLKDYFASAGKSMGYLLESGVMQSLKDSPLSPQDCSKIGSALASFSMKIGVCCDIHPASVNAKAALMSGISTAGGAIWDFGTGFDSLCSFGGVYCNLDLTVMAQYSGDTIDITFYSSDGI